MTTSYALRITARGLLLLALCAFASASAVAQSATATLSGTVEDQNRAVVPGASVTAVNTGTTLERRTTTNGSGDYTIPLLPPGTYIVRVEAQGFAQVRVDNVVLNIGDRKALQIQLKAGDINAAVTVQSDTVTLNTTDGSVSTVVDQNYIKNMPLNGRSFQDLILLTPGVVTQTSQVTTFVSSGLGTLGEFSVNGQRPESNYYAVDGVSANVGAAGGNNMTQFGGASGSLAATTALGTTQALVSVDALQEFRVQSSTYSAEYGRNPGAQISFETKSGTNQWHGTAYDYLRNGYFDAQDWFNNYFGVKVPALRQNDFGGTLGGPLLLPRFGEGGRQPGYNGRNKTFFFFSYEGLRLVASRPAAAAFVPDAALRASTPAPLNQVLNAFPMPSPNGLEDAANGFGQFIGGSSGPSSIDSTSVRMDHVVSDKLRFFFRFSDTSSNSAAHALSTVERLTPSVKRVAAYTMRTYTAGVTSALSSHFSNEFRLNYSSNQVTQSIVIDAFGGNTPVDLAHLAGGGTGSSAFVILSYGGYFTFIQQGATLGAQRQWNLVDAVSLSLGRHQFKFGVDYRRLAPFAQDPTPAFFYNFLSKNAVVTNSANSVHSSVFAPAYPLYRNFSAFAQDEWKVSSRLSLSVGLRWEVNPAPGVTQGLKPYTIDFRGSDPNTWGLAPQGTPLWKTTWHNFAPRLGIAYVLRNTPGHETVVRGGGGVFFDTGQLRGSDSFLGPGFVANSFPTCPPCSFPGSLSATLPVIVNPPAPPYNLVRGFSTHLQLPYTLEWNASVEQALGRSQTVTFSYVGSHAARLLELNRFSAPTNPITHSFFLNRNGLTSDYDALQVQFRRRLSRGLSLLGSYGWSHCIDYGSTNYGNYQFGYLRGNCDFDVRHNLSTAFSYDLPQVKQGQFLKAVLNHWGLDNRFTARTAFPVLLVGRQLFDPATSQIFQVGLNSVPGQPVYLYGANCAAVLQGLGDLTPGQGCPGGRAINPQAFANVASGLGSAPRNFARGFGAWQMDLAIRRDFKIHENLKLQFRAEAFNIFNHPNFGVINPSFGQKTFGQATSTLANSLGVLSPLYQLGGPRSMQFALKLMF